MAVAEEDSATNSTTDWGSSASSSRGGFGGRGEGFGGSGGLFDGGPCGGVGRDRGVGGYDAPLCICGFECAFSDKLICMTVFVRRKIHRFC